ncbi:hypothetical protein Vafri_4133 [Volvox africanus]|uniref:Uncharacterized protein n=1 Tax=Volvox africanus TaxID=51714 RepID=A0A8J4AT08_9CHLO|nr:hypothetical protein Vafri_4133 [Volvox africanus]
MGMSPRGVVRYSNRGSRRINASAIQTGVILCLLMLRPTPSSAQFTFNLLDDLVNNGPRRGGFRNGTFRLRLGDAMDHMRQFTDPLLFGSGGAASGRSGDSSSDGSGSGSRGGGGPYFGFEGFGRAGGWGGFGGPRGGPGPGPGGGGAFQEDSLKKVTEPLTGNEFQAYMDSIMANTDAAAIASAVLNLASAVVYTVSGALATASVGLSIIPAIPNFFFGLFNLEVQAVSFLQGLQENFQGLFLDELTNVLARINALRERIRSGAFIQQLEQQLQQIQTVRAMLRDLRENHPIAAALQRAGVSAQQARANAAAGNVPQARADAQNAAAAYQEAQDKYDEVANAIIQLKLGG